MILDNLETYVGLDLQDMHSEIVRLPDQIEEAWALGQNLPLPKVDKIERVIVSGMGGSAIGSDLLIGLVSNECPVPAVTNRDYALPAWARGPGTLFIASSHSGNTEETLAAYEMAKARECTIMVVSTGGKLAERAHRDGNPHWKFSHAGQPRAGVGYSFGLLLAVFARLGLIADPTAAIEETVAALRAQAERLVKSVPAVQNPAKRYGMQLMGRSFVVFGAEFLTPVARRWKTQVNELPKAWAQFEELPEANHNALCALEVPENVTSSTFAMFLVSSRYGDRNALRMELTRKAYMLEGVSTDYYKAKGQSQMTQQWTTLQFGDFMSYYLSIAYGTDPTPVDALANFKNELAGL